MKTPAWAHFFPPDRWNRFVDVLRDDLARRGAPAELVLEEGCVRIGEGVFGLTNLAQMCNADDVERWPLLVRNHFDVGLSPDTGDAAERASRDFASARALVKLRLWDRAELVR